jgi:t-SNARE complex subunit (syntaxin)
MLDPTFDPFDALMTLDKNMQNIVQAHNLLARRVEEQQEVIDVLIKGLNAANLANQHLLEQGLNNLYRDFKG